MITLKLDANAVSALFSEPEAKMELQRCVIAEICRRMFENYLGNDMVLLINSICKEKKDELVRALREDATLMAHLDDAFNKEIALVKRRVAILGRNEFELKPAFKEQIAEIVKTTSEKALKQAGVDGEKLILSAAEAAFTRVNERALNNIDHQIDLKIERITNAEIERRIEERLKKAMKS